MKHATRDAGAGFSSAARPPGFRGLPGLTLLELTVVIVVLLSLASLLLIGARAWKRGSDRSVCVANIASVQKAVRGYANMSGLDPGATVVGLELKVVGPDRFFESLPVCPGEGVYTLGGDQVPALGDLYMTCSLATDFEHVPDTISDW